MEQKTGECFFEFAGPKGKKGFRGRLLLYIFVIACVGFLSYINVLKGRFLFDDEILVVNNAFIKSWSHVGSAFLKDVGESGGRKMGFYRPLQTGTAMLDYSLGRTDPFVYHLTNVVLHILAALSLFWFLQALFGQERLSFLTSLLFVVHPVHTEAVSYISGRADPLFVLFLLLGFTLYIKGTRHRSLLLYFLAGLAYAAALLSKEAALILPVLLLLYHAASRKKISVTGFSWILGISVVYLVVRRLVLGAEISQPLSGGFLTRLPGFFVAMASYARLLILPFNLHMEYGLPSFSLGDVRALAGLVLVGAGWVYAFSRRSKNPFVFFCIVWFFVTLLPVSNIFPVNAFMAEHWLYLPSVGFFILVAAGLECLFRKKKGGLASGLAVALTLYYFCLTVQQNTYWKDPVVFYTRTLRFAPNSPRLYNNLGNDYAQRGQKEEALAAYMKAVELRSDYPDAYYNLGITFMEMGRWDDAIPAFQKGVDLNPRQPDLWLLLGAAYGQKGDKGTALTMVEKAVALDPTLAAAHFQAGLLASEVGRADDAIASYERVLELDPKNAMACNNLAVIYYNRGEVASAVKYADHAVQLGYPVHPDFLKLLEKYRSDG